MGLGGNREEVAWSHLFCLASTFRGFYEHFDYLMTFGANCDIRKILCISIESTLYVVFMVYLRVMSLAHLKTHDFRNILYSP